MKLYYFADGCSLATHIALREAGIEPDLVKVDVQTRQTEEGGAFPQVNPKGYVPALILDDGSMLTENVALLDWVAQQSATLKPAEGIARTRQNEMLAFISTEMHRPFLFLFFMMGEAEKPMVANMITGRFAHIAARLEHDYLFGDRFSVADAFLYVMLRWAQGSGIALSNRFAPYIARMEARPTVQAALRAEKIAGLKAA